MKQYPKAKKAFLISGVTFNIGLLAYYKYTDFFIQNINSNFDTAIPLLNIALPLGISFFTFQQVAYVVDSYHGEEKDYNFFNYALFVSFFPQLIAGPIIHHKEIIPQFEDIKNKILSYKHLVIGLFIFAVGLFKKTVIADGISSINDAVYFSVYKPTIIESWLTCFGTQMQVYFDFSGYSDMAIGAAMLFNIKLPENFKSPHQSLDIAEFWQRWHITLTRFMKKYLYFPLGGNRKGKIRTYVNIFTVFFLGGLWHGASWGFILWGTLHGLGIIVNRLWKKLNIEFWKPLSVGLTLLFVSLVGLLNRNVPFEKIVQILKGLIDFNSFSIPTFGKIEMFLNYPDRSVIIGLWPLFLIIITTLLSFTKFSVEGYDLAEKFKPNLKWVILTGIIFIISIMQFGRIKAFLYFQF